MQTEPVEMTALRLSKTYYPPGTLGAYLKMKLTFIENAIAMIKGGCTMAEAKEAMMESHNYVDEISTILCGGGEQ